MIYRIRYKKQRGRGEGELVVEANSPNEAMVKFCHVHNGRLKGDRAREVVTSVTPEDSGGEPAWTA
jgi:hypothetical protein